MGPHGSAHRDPETSAYVTASASIDHLRVLLHGESTRGLACWLRLEDAWLFGEGVDTLACLATVCRRRGCMALT